MKQRFFLILLSVFVVAMFLSWTTNIFLADEQLVSFVSDDAFYYLQVAENIVDGNGSSFDAINQTNGYHPLWMLTLVVLRNIFSDISKVLFLRIALIFQSLLTLLTFVLIWDALRKHVQTLPITAGLIFFSISFFRPITGLETALVSFSIALSVWLLIKEKSVILVGFSLTLIYLSRLDFALVSGFLGLGWIWNQSSNFNRISFVLGVKIFFIPIVIGIIYMVFNQTVFGYPLPITFVIKTSSGTDLLSALERAVVMYGSRTFFAPLLLFPLFLWFYERRTKIQISPLPKPVQRVLIALACGSLVHIVYMYFSVGFGAARWHLIPHGVAYAFVLASALESMGERISGRYESIIKLAVILIVSVISLATNLRIVFQIVDPPETNPSVQLYDTANWIKTNTPSESIIALKDAGIVGYFSDRSVINLDGLINSFGTYESIIDGKLCQKLNHEWAVDYFASILPSDNRPGYAIQEYVLPPWATTTQITVMETDELFRSKEAGQFNIGVWNYHSSSCSPLPS